MATFLLIHGAWHGAWCWDRIAPLLRAAGHNVIAPDLPALGFDRTPWWRASLCTYALRKSSLARIGLFREYFETSEDLDYQFRVGEAGRVRYLPSSAYFYRLHSSSVTHTQRDGRRAFFEDMARRFLEQRRSDGTDALMKGAPPAPPSPLHGGAPSLGRHLHEMLMGQAWRDLESGRAQIAISNAWRAVASDLSSASVWKDAVVLTLKATLTRRRDPER